MRDDVKYSPPVNRAVTSADVKYAIERSLLPGVANGYAQTYLNGIDGFDDAIKAGPGATRPEALRTSAASPTPDDTTLVIKLDNTTSLGVERRAVAADLAPRSRRSTRSSSTPRTPRPTASIRSRPART